MGKKIDKAEVFPRHMMGKRCGYTLNKDGSIKVAPTYIERLRAIQDQQDTINDLAASFSRALYVMQGGLSPLKRQLYDDMRDDYGMSPEQEFLINFNTGVLTKEPKK